MILQTQASILLACLVSSREEALEVNLKNKAFTLNTLQSHAMHHITNERISREIKGIKS